MLRKLRGALVTDQRALPVGPPTLNDPHSGTSLKRTKTAVFPASTAVTQPTRRSLRGVLNGDGRQGRSLLLLFRAVKLPGYLYAWSTIQRASSRMGEGCQGHTGETGSKVC